MASINKKQKFSGTTHEGGPARKMSKKEILERTVFSCLLWENNFYEDGESIAQRIYELSRVIPEDAARIAIEAATVHNLRHAPLVCVVGILSSIQTHLIDVVSLIETVCTRADSILELFALYSAFNNENSFAYVLKKAAANILNTLNEYQLAKYKGNGKKEFTFKDLLKICHPKPKNDAQSVLFKKVIENTLASPQTWENQLSAGKDKKPVFETMIKEKTLGALAFLRNLRNMDEAGIDRAWICQKMSELKTEKILPFQFITAGLVNNWAQPTLENLLTDRVKNEKLAGKTLLLVDISGSMSDPLNSRLFARRDMAAGALAMLIREMTDYLEIKLFGQNLYEVPSYGGFGLVNTCTSRNEGTYLGSALHEVKRGKGFDRIIVITDEQSHDKVPDPAIEKAYMLNVAPFQNSVGHGNWEHINGWSDSVVKYIQTIENKKFR